MINEFRGIPIRYLGNAFLLALRDMVEGELRDAIQEELAFRYPPDAPPRLVDVPTCYREQYEEIVVETLQERMRKRPGRFTFPSERKEGSA
jgi:hypothetical protein